MFPVSEPASKCIYPAIDSKQLWIPHVFPAQEAVSMSSWLPFVREPANKYRTLQPRSKIFFWNYVSCRRSHNHKSEPCYHMTMFSENILDT